MRTPRASLMNRVGTWMPAGCHRASGAHVVTEIDHEAPKVKPQKIYTTVCKLLQQIALPASGTQTWTLERIWGILLYSCADSICRQGTRPSTIQTAPTTKWTNGKVKQDLFRHLPRYKFHYFDLKESYSRLLPNLGTSFRLRRRRGCLFQVL